MLLQSLALLVALAHPAPSDTADCADAARFLRDSVKVIAIVEADTIDDWRTKQRVPGCRITGVGRTTIGVNAEAVRFYERVRAAGWTRTPDPRDAPTEASLRFRMGRSDCLYNLNGQALLGTDAEHRVNVAVQPGPGETRYQVFVMCMPAMAAAPRG